MLMKKPRHRVFDYTPRFYDPKKDEKEKVKERIHFSRDYSKIKKKKRSMIFWIGVIIAIIYIYIKLQGM
jgi:hypothetical protein